MDTDSSDDANSTAAKGIIRGHDCVLTKETRVCLFVLASIFSGKPKRTAS